MRFILFILFFCSSLTPAIAQDPLATKIEWLNKAKPTSNLFVHFDKNIYANNELVYFTGYLLKSGINSIKSHKIMAVALVKDEDNSLIVQDKFIMESGLSFGSLTLPDSILTGNYHFIAYTDQLVNGTPEAIFIQQITIKTNIDPAFKASIKLNENSNSKDNHSVLLTVLSKDNKFLPKPTSISYHYGKFTASGKTDLSGQLLLNLAKQDEIADPNLYVKLKYDKDSTFLNIALPQRKNRASVKFYPSGGNLVNGLTSTVAWEVKDQQNRPLTLKALLYKDHQVIDTIETSSYGIGKFNLTADQNAKYSVKLVHDGVVDSLYELPKALATGLILSLQNAVVKDTLTVTLSSNGPKRLFIRLHNFRTSFIYSAFNLKSNPKTIKIPLSELPEGLAAISVMDSLHRPLAERLFLANYNDTEKLSLSTDSNSYKTRQEVKLKLKLLGEEESGVVSIAVVQYNRIDQKKMTDIESYTYLKNELSNLPVNFKGTAYQERGYIEQILLVKGWRRFTWQEVEAVNEQATNLKLDSLKVAGWVTKAKKPLKEPINIGAIGDQESRLTMTDYTGAFDLNTPKLIAESGKKLFLFVGANNQYNYEVKFNDPFKKIGAELAKQVSMEQVYLPSTLSNNAELVIKGNEKSTRLNEVKITAKKDNSFNFSKGLPGRNACGDYVCRYNILNCRNHPDEYDNTQPIPGRKYKVGNLIRTYAKCVMEADLPPNLYQFDGLHWAKEFYMDDYKDLQEPAYFSTIYWNYGTILTIKAPTEISFYTGDITGTFIVRVQGVHGNRPIYAEKLIEVRAK